MANSTKVMIDVEGGNNILYLPLDKIVQSASEPNINSSTQSNPTNAPSPSLRELTDQVIDEIRRRNRQDNR
jgi:membrane protease subunit HflK